MENLDQWCFAWFEESPAQSRKRAELWREAQWTPASIVSISFMDGEAELRGRVEQTARRWTHAGCANLFFDFREGTTDTDIRISFRRPGSWSALGTTCRRIAKSEPTMNFGWLRPDSTDSKLERVVLHEFGHALGLVHEHQLPAGRIQWNKPAVYADLQPRWSKAMIDKNVFATIAVEEAAIRMLNPTSIMMYPIKKSWTLDGFSTALNATLSRTDIAFIRNMYS
jgi:serralysin